MSAPHQPRYAQFARVHDFTPGNEPPMYEYAAWLKGKWSQWFAEQGRKPTYLTEKDHAEFDAWLEKETT